MSVSQSQSGQSYRALTEHTAAFSFCAHAHFIELLTRIRRVLQARQFFFFASPPRTRENYEQRAYIYIGDDTAPQCGQ